MPLRTRQLRSHSKEIHMDAMKLRAAMKALDSIDKLLDDRDAEDADRLDEMGMVKNKGSDANLDDEDGGLGDKSTSDKPGHKSTQEADDDGQSDMDTSSEDPADFMAELRKMSKNSTDARNVRKLLDDDEEAEYD